jgi:hypothetical protein
MKRPSPASSGASAWIESVQLTEHFASRTVPKVKSTAMLSAIECDMLANRNLVAGDEIKVFIEIELVEQKQKQVAGWRPLACPGCSSYPN